VIDEFFECILYVLCVDGCVWLIDFVDVLELEDRICVFGELVGVL